MTALPQGGARQQALIREVNERVAELNESFEVDGRSAFLCECDDPACIESLELTPAEYELVRADDARFVVVPGHEQRDVERVIEESNRFIVVERVEAAAPTERTSGRRRS